MVQVRDRDAAEVRDVLRAHGLGELAFTPAAGSRRGRPRRDPHAARRALRRKRAASLRGVWSETTHRPCSACATTRPAPTRSTTAASRRGRSRPGPAAQLRSASRRRRALHRRAARGRAWRSCASRASTARSRWPRRSTAPASRRRRAHERHPRRPRRAVYASAALAACGGFSYGDVLGAGEGWAKSILFNPRARDEFAALLRAPRHLRARRVQRLPDDVQPARAHPRRRRTGRASCATAPSSSRRAWPWCAIEPSPSLFLRRHGGLAAAHRRRPRRRPRRVRVAEACERCGAPAWSRRASWTTTARPTEHYPDNPNGSPHGITALTTPDGRATIMMPHPERVFRGVQLSWRPDDAGTDSPWMRLFRNARLFVG